MRKSVGLLAVLMVLVAVPAGVAAADPLFRTDRRPGDFGQAWAYPNYGQAPFTTRASSDCGYMTARVKQGGKHVFRRVWRCW